jgi:CelD/BcsL family acetyltransferase involved in cellulose biosynthesis
VEALTLAQLDQEAERYDALVQASSDIDRFCSSSDWILPAANGLKPGRDPFVRRGEHGYASFMATEHEGRAWLEPLEAIWGLGCPLIGDPVELAVELAVALQMVPRAVMICGLERASLRFQATASVLHHRYDLGLAPPTRRFIASLEGGLDGFLSRRTHNFRRSLSRAERRAEDIAFVEVRDPDEGWRRILAVEGRSWKGLEGVGFASAETLEFYGKMIPRLHRRGALRLMFAQREGRDVAYILGGIFGDTYRGLQFSFADDHAHLSLGNLCQLRQIEALCDEKIGFYDLGSEVEYKRRWGEIIHETVTLLAWPK